MTIYNREDSRTVLPQLEKNLNNKIEDVQKEVDLLKADYVVEQGTDGIWTYRKWASGVAECWGRRGSTSYTMTSTSGYAYYTTFSQALPSGLFTSITSALSGRCGGTSGQALISTNIYSISTSSFNCYIWQPASGTQNVDVAFNIKGTWK